ncbi:hypothetical protein RJB83_11220 [Staphylococcus epidermidis]|jgi:hypothetical protein|nr:MULTISPECIES: hypothetical protein [Bacilli]ELG7156054.1 hypothetical protein [Staphylococcus aureus]HDH7443077.1 hypothetical protein [Escherichia coli]ELL1200972.1 hypothetical protein [Staphylococcus aureus]MDH9287424.1 hypothetical protein [Staphylococcus epidermidis]MDH9530789.1 hypothetical protein [Staphylococcus epidermidis]
MSKPWIEVMRWCVENPCEDPIQFMDCWLEGRFDVCRKEWPEVPESCYPGTTDEAVDLRAQAEAAIGPDDESYFEYEDMIAAYEAGYAHGVSSR